MSVLLLCVILKACIRAVSLFPVIFYHIIMPEQITTLREQESRAQEVLHKLYEKRRDSGKETIDRDFADIPLSLRQDAQAAVEQDLALFRGQVAPALYDQAFKEALRRRLQETRNTFLDRRFDLPNRPYVERQMYAAIDERVAENASLNDLRRIGRVFIDVNGLKAVNDLAGAAQGDEYLRRIANFLRNEDAPIRRKLLEQGISVLVSVEGGDEFALTLKGDKPITADLINEVLSFYERGIGEIKVDDLLDLSDERVRAKLGDVADKVPTDFKFKATIAIGGATLADSFFDADVSEKDDYGTALAKMRGSLFARADAEMKKHKIETKRRLRETGSPLALLYERTDEARQLEIEIQRLRSEGLELRQKAGAGADLAGIVETMVKDGEIPDNRVRPVLDRLRTQ